MAFRRRSSLLLTPFLLSLLAVGSLATGPGSIAVFWGRNKNEGTLREACDTGTTVLISFLTGFGAHGSYSLDLSSHPLSGVHDDVKHCQSKGILALLSIGRPAAAGANYSLPSSRSAADLADNLWNYLGGSRTGGGAADRYDELAQRLHVHKKSYRGRSGMTLTATVRCTYPDLGLTAATGLFSRVHVRLYGADLRYYPKGQKSSSASPEADQDTYLFQKDLYYAILQFAQKVPNYDGIMVWDRYYDKKNHYMSNS
ncbi:unnamed protein product [Urochloa decumbens]|uniref:GH18 domain-containing protein n=1 Tax=Urochloa decumbens TaxID=240449 RepID=A0ABC9HE27_9POAL